MTFRRRNILARRRGVLDVNFPGRGSWASGVFVSSNTTVAAVDAFGTYRGEPIRCYGDFAGGATWDQITKWGSDSAVGGQQDRWRTFRDRGAVVAVTLGMMPTAPPYVTNLAEGATGAYNEFWRQCARERVGSFRSLQNVRARIGHEMNLDASFRHSIQRNYNGGNPNFGNKALVASNFRDYWRHMVTSLWEIDPTMEIEFSPGATPEFARGGPPTSNNIILPEQYNPGPDYYTHINVDTYDYSTTYNTTAYRTGTEAYRRTIQQAAFDNKFAAGQWGPRGWADYAQENNKRFSMTEWGIWSRPDQNAGGDAPLFVENMHAFLSEQSRRAVIRGGSRVPLLSDDWYNNNDGNTDGAHELFPSAQFPLTKAAYAALTWGVAA